MTISDNNYVPNLWRFVSGAVHDTPSFNRISVDDYAKINYNTDDMTLYPP
jgi:hypothetical protein